MPLRPTFTFIPPALPSPAERHPIRWEWIHEIKHDGYRMMVRRDLSRVRLLKDWTGRFPTSLAMLGKMLPLRVGNRRVLSAALRPFSIK